MIEIPNCPIVRPTTKEFNNFNEFVERMDRLYKHKFGMIKVIPPSEWKPRSSPIDNQLDNFIIQGPIEQNVSGKASIYECLHIQKKSMTLKEYQTKMAPSDHFTDGLPSHEVEKLFWKNIAFSPPLYGADLLKTLMEDNAGAWNLNRLQSLLKYAMNLNVKGVTSPYCYVGSWKTLFCWHKQDLDLSAINYIHKGKSKFWYSIPPSQQHIIQREARNHFPQHFSRCGEYLRHKTTLINPYLLKKKYPELQITKIEHKQNQFILVFGGAYHCGFNFGFNIAQAVNYGTVSWLNQLLTTKHCNCLKSSVRASQIQIYNNLSKSHIAKTPQFHQFEKVILRRNVKQEQKEADQKQIRCLKSQYSKRIKKNRHLKNIVVAGESYKVDNWAQCDKCNLWRKLQNPLDQKQSFKCSQAHKKCHQKQKISKDYISL